MISRRRMLAAAAALFAIGPVVHAQPRSRSVHIGILAFASPRPAIPKPITALLEALAERGWVEGGNLRVELAWAEGDTARLPALADALVRKDVELIVATGDSSTRAAMKATRTIPIVMATSGDAVGAGFVTSLARPGGNVTGVTSLGPALSAKRLQLLRELQPGANRIAVVLNPANGAHALEWKETLRVAQEASIRLQAVELRDPAGAAAVLDGARGSPMDALVVLTDAVTYEARDAIIAFAAARRLPAMYPAREWVEAGGLAAYGVTHVDQFGQSAAYIDRILRGARPADLPVEQPAIVRLWINTAAARKLGISLPPALLARADEVVE